MGLEPGQAANPPEHRGLAWRRLIYLSGGGGGGGVRNPALATCGLQAEQPESRRPVHTLRARNRGACKAP